MNCNVCVVCKNGKLQQKTFDKFLSSTDLPLSNPKEHIDKTSRGSLVSNSCKMHW
jgi:hypothetical protein